MREIQGDRAHHLLLFQQQQSMSRPVPLVYQEGKEILEIAIWYPDRVDETRRKVIYEGLKSNRRIDWISFLQTGDYDERDSVPKEFDGLKPADLGVETLSEFFTFDNLAE